MQGVAKKYRLFDQKFYEGTESITAKSYIRLCHENKNIIYSGDLLFL